MLAAALGSTPSSSRKRYPNHHTAVLHLPGIVTVTREPVTDPRVTILAGDGTTGKSGAAARDALLFLGLLHQICPDMIERLLAGKCCPHSRWPSPNLLPHARRHQNPTTPHPLLPRNAPDHPCRPRLGRRCDFGNDNWRYEAIPPDGHHHHHHIICKKCRHVETIETCVADALTKLVAAKGYTDVSHSLEFFGICRACRR